MLNGITTQAYWEVYFKNSSNNIVASISLWQIELVWPSPVLPPKLVSW